MSWLIEYLVPAFFVSVSALVALGFARRALPAIRFGLALIGLAAWVVPWPLLEFSSLPLGAALNDWVTSNSAQAAAIKQGLVTTIEAAAPVGQISPFWWLALFLPGVLWFVMDLNVHRSTVGWWMARSRSADELTRFLPSDLLSEVAEIRVVENSSVAVATGFFHPKIWIGERIADAQAQQIALTHEACHIRRGDPVWLMIIGLVARLHWFNPLVIALKREAILAIESGCDEMCARLLGRRRYLNTLAQLVLAGQNSSNPVLAAALHTPSVDLMRLASLKRKPCMDLRAWAAVGVVAIACAGGVAWSATTLSNDGIGTSTGIPESSRYGYDAPPVWSDR